MSGVIKSDEKITVPTCEEIERLPRWARVSFAARCARRVASVFEADLPDTLKNHVEGLKSAVTCAERGASDAYSSAYECDNAVAKADLANAHATRFVAARAAESAAAAASASATSVNSFVSAKAAESAAAASANAAHDEVRGQVMAAIWRDYELLRSVVNKEHWTDQTPVTPEFFGDLWSHGKPSGWPATPS